MAHEMVTLPTRREPRGKVRELLMKHNAEEPGKVNVKRERFLTLLKNRYDYTNEEAVDELERLLRQFYRINQGFRIDRTRLKLKHSPPE